MKSSISRKCKKKNIKRIFKGIAGKFTLRNKACYFLKKYSQIETKERIFMLQIFNYTAGKGDCIRLHYTGKSGVIRNVINDLL